jgi:hypothetical protein
MKHLSLILLFALSPFVAIAHTSDERYVDGFIVDLSTAPVAPWVGEKVGMSFVFRDPTSGGSTTTVVSATFSIDALMRTGNKRQEVIFESGQFAVENGGFATSYAFSEEGTYDIHLTFVDKEGNEHLAGFRKQVRSGVPSAPRNIDALSFFLTISMVGILAFWAGRISTKKS